MMPTCMQDSMLCYTNNTKQLRTEKTAHMTGRVSVLKDKHAFCKRSKMDTLIHKYTEWLRHVPYVAVSQPHP